MAYQFPDMGIGPGNLLDYVLEGGDPHLTLPVLRTVDGVDARGARLNTCFRTSTPIPPELFPALPTRIVVRRGSDGLFPDSAPVAQFGGRLASDRLKDLIEELEPGVHQFLPITEAVGTEGKPLERAFYFLNILTRLSAVVEEKSTVEWAEIKFGARFMKTKLVAKNDFRLVLKRSVIDGHHIWRGTRDELSTFLFCSDELKERMVHAGMRPVPTDHCEEE